MLSREFHGSRRALYHEILLDKQMAVMFAGKQKRKAGDEYYPFSVYRNFYYLTGCEEPEAVYLAYRFEGKTREALFIRRTDEKAEVYEGRRLRPEEAGEKYGIVQVGYLDEMDEAVCGIMGRAKINTLWLDLEEKRMEEQDEERQFAAKMQRNYPFLNVCNSCSVLAEMRKIKDEEEIEEHRRACAVTVSAVNYMARNIRPGMTESQMEAYFDFIVKTRGCGHAFATVAAAGKNACILHYEANTDVAEDGDLVLFDLGARSGYYCADVSRTFPVNGKFTERQRRLYEIVLKGLQAAIEAAYPGQIKDDLQKISRQVMAREFVRIGMIRREEEIDRYYLHGSGHFIGLYTHDVGESPKNRLEENMVFTLEPGLYFPEEGIGIRIEDTLLVTENGCEVLTAGIPKTVEEIEALMEAEIEN